MKIDVPVLGMVKDDHHRTRGLVYLMNGQFTEIDLRNRPFLFRYMGTIQEEVHRFSIDYHRGLRDKGKLRSVLDEIQGIGPARRNALLGHFGSISNIKKADISELMQAPGITEKAAKAVYEKFHN
jgi:excinuclease ABC subunit C